MALANVLLLSQISGHVLLFILSLCIVLPLSINLNQFWYVCLEVELVIYMTNTIIINFIFTVDTVFCLQLENGERRTECLM